jgi:hypothetical protein
MTLFGSWVTVFDTSGQVKRDNDSRVLTMAGIAVANENADAVRTAVRKSLKVKWRDGALVGFRTAEKIIVSHTLQVAVTHMTGISLERWQDFWDEGRRKADRLKELTGQSANFAAGDSTSRLLLFATIFAHCATLVLKGRGWKNPAPPGRRDTVEFSAVFDTDIHNPEARAVLTETLKHWAKSSRFGQLANLDMEISGRFQTEQEEPLILLADYIAGAFNHVHRDAVIGKPVAPLQQVQKTVETFREALGSHLQEVTEPFDEIHPLLGMWEDP